MQEGRLAVVVGHRAYRQALEKPTDWIPFVRLFILNALNEYLAKNMYEMTLPSYIRVGAKYLNRLSSLGLSPELMAAPASPSDEKDVARIKSSIMKAAVKASVPYDEYVGRCMPFAGLGDSPPPLETVEKSAGIEPSAFQRVQALEAMSRLSDVQTTIITLRAAGYELEEIGQELLDRGLANKPMSKQSVWYHLQEILRIVSDDDG